MISTDIKRRAGPLAIAGFLSTIGLWQIFPSFGCLQAKSFQLQETSTLTPTRGSTSGSRCGLGPQTPVIGSRSPCPQPSCFTFLSDAHGRNRFGCIKNASGGTLLAFSVDLKQRSHCGRNVHDTCVTYALRTYRHVAAQ